MKTSLISFASPGNCKSSLLCMKEIEDICMKAIHIKKKERNMKATLGFFISIFIRVLFRIAF